MRRAKGCSKATFKSDVSVLRRLAASRVMMEPPTLLGLSSIARAVATGSKCCTIYIVANNMSWANGRFWPIQWSNAAILECCLRENCVTMPKQRENRGFGMRILVNIILLLSIIAIIAYGVMRNNATDEHKAAPKIEHISLDDMRASVEAEMESLPGSQTLDGDGYNRLATLGGGLVKISYGDVTTLDGLTAATDVRITQAGNESMGLQIDRLTIWGGDVDGILALAAGDFAGEFRIADRLEMQGIRSFGFETLVETFSNKTNEALLDAMGSAVGEDIAEVLEDQDMSVDVQKYAFTAETLVLEGLTYHGVSDLPDFTGDVGAWDLVRMMAKLYRSLSVDLSAYTNLSYDFAMEDAVQSMQMSMSSPLIAAMGYNRGDLDMILYDDFKGNADVTGKDVDLPMDIGFHLKGFGWTGLQISDVLEALEARTLPSMEDTDILSLGKWTIRGFDYSLNGQPFYSINAADIDVSEFHWLIPTRIAGMVDGETLHLGSLGDSVVQTLAATGEMDNADQIKKIVSDVQASLQKYDLEDLVFNSDFDIQWSPESGRTTWDQTVEFEGFSDTTFNVSGMMPTYASIKTAAAETDQTEALDAEETASMQDEAEYAVPARSPRSLAFQEVFSSSTSLESLKLAVSDRGGIDKSFALAIDIAKIVPVEIDSPQLQMLRQSDPEQLKNGIAAIINLAAGQAGAEFPPAKDWMHAVANFLLSGGTLILAIEPDQPITAQTLAALDEMEGPPSPDVIVDTFGISVRQVAP